MMGIRVSMSPHGIHIVLPLSVRQPVRPSVRQDVIFL
jgi:hypothetical protein